MESGYIHISYIVITHSVHTVGSRKKKPPCIRNKSQFSYKIMNETIRYCSKTIGCTKKVVSYSWEPTVKAVSVKDPASEI